MKKFWSSLGSIAGGTFGVVIGITGVLVWIAFKLATWVAGTMLAVWIGMMALGFFFGETEGGSEPTHYEERARTS